MGIVAARGEGAGLKGDHRFGSWGDKPVVAGTAAQIASDLDPGAWHRLPASNGTKGARLHDRAYLELADLEADEYSADLSGIRTRGLLIRSHVADGDLASFTTWVSGWHDLGNPRSCGRTSLSGAGKVPAMRSIVGIPAEGMEDSFETARNELGLDRNETRSWHGWHRHVSLVMLASSTLLGTGFAMLAAIRARANTAPPKRTRMRSQT